MKTLLKRIRLLLKNKRIRIFWTRFVSGVAAFVVFVTTYALVLPAITMELEANCGIEAHQHADECYEERLICTIPEDPGHHHDDSCYRHWQEQVCILEEHTHDETCPHDEEGNLICEIPEHVHDESCFEDRSELTCTLEESDGHQHDALCYETVLICDLPEHIHSEECYSSPDEEEDQFVEIEGVESMVDSVGSVGAGTPEDEDFNLYDDGAAGDAYDDSGVVEDSDEVWADDNGGVEDSGDVWADDNEWTGDNNGAVNDSGDIWDDGSEYENSFEETDASGGVSVDEGSFEEGNIEEGNLEEGYFEEGPAEDIFSEEEYFEDGSADGTESVDEEMSSAVLTDTDNDGNDPAADVAADEPDAELSGTGDSASENAAADGTEAVALPADVPAESDPEKTTDPENTDPENTNADKEAQVPALEPLDFASVLNGRTDVYYHHVEEGESIEDSSLISDWKKVDKNTELGPNDLIRVYLSYTIPAGSLNETNQTAVYQLPANLHLTDAQVKSINAIENGIAAPYIDYNTLTLLDPDNYHKYLGAEAVEGTRTPGQDLEDYLKKLAADEEDAQEFISAVVRVEDLYDTEGLHGEKGAYLSQGLRFTFSPYTIEKNQKTLDAAGQTVKTGEAVRGWFSLDFNLTQVDWAENEYLYREEANREELNSEESAGGDSAGEEADPDGSAGEIIDGEAAGEVANPDGPAGEDADGAVAGEEADPDGANGVEVDSKEADPEASAAEETVSGEPVNEESVTGEPVLEAIVWTTDILFRMSGIDGNGEEYDEIRSSLRMVEPVEQEELNIRNLNIRDGQDAQDMQEGSGELAEEDPALAEDSETEEDAGTADDDEESEAREGDIQETQGENEQYLTEENKEDQEAAESKEEVADSADQKGNIFYLEDPDAKKDVDDKSSTGDQKTDKDDLSETIMPAMSFEDSIRVRTGKPAGVEDGSAGTAAANAAEALPKKAKVTVRVEADEGTFPAGTTMVLSAVEDMDAVAETVRDAVENAHAASENGSSTSENSGSADKNEKPAADNNGSEANRSGSAAGDDQPAATNSNQKTYGFQAVDISFRDKDGKEIEPAKPVRVALTSSIVEQVKKEKEEDANSAIADPVVVHVDDAGNAETMDLVAPDEIEPAKGKTEEELLKELAEKELAEKELEEKEKEAEEKEEAENKETAENEKEAGEEETEENRITEENNTAGQGEREENPTADQGEKEENPTEDNTAAVENNAEENEAADEKNPANEPEIEETVNSEETESAAESATVFFEADSFSVYAIVYTVDFYWEVDGKMYDFSLPGGGFVSFQNLIEVLGIADGTYEGKKQADNAESTEEARQADTSLTMNHVNVSEATRDFVTDVEKVEFSNPELVWVGKINGTTTAGELKKANELDTRYSAELMEEQIAEINAQKIEAGDWALISMRPFTSEESLVVTMKTGEVFTIKVTDAQISTHVITADGEDYIITISYGPEAEIPEGATLEAEEIDPESDAYLEYIALTKAALDLRAGDESEEPIVETGDEVSDIIDKPADKDNPDIKADVSGSEEASANLENEEIKFARFFDIRILKDGNKIEPKAAVKVSITYADAVDVGDGEELLAVHFGEQGTELIDTSTDQEMKEIVFTQGSFSVTGTVVSTQASGWPAATGSYVLYTQVGGNYYAIKHDGNLTPVTVENNTVTFPDTDQQIHTNDYMWTYNQTGHWGANWQWITDNTISYKEGETPYYLNPVEETGINQSNRALARNNNKIHLSGGNTDYYLTANNLQIFGQGNATNGIPIYFANNFPRSVKLHFVDENGNPLDGFTYNGQTIDGSTYVVTTDWAQEQGTINLESFTKTGWTLSNTHKSTWKDLEGNYTGNNTNYPHTIIGNQLIWEDGTIKYLLYYANSDKAGSHYFAIGTEPNRTDTYWKYDYGNHPGADPTDYTAVDDNDPNPYDYYLVYSQTPAGGGSGGSGSGSDLGDIPEIGHTKEKTSNYDGTYNLELGVSSEAIEKEKHNHINVLLVVDTSSSMRRATDSETDLGNGDNTIANNNENSRIHQTEDAVKSFVTDLMKKNEADPNAVEMELITFNMGASVYQEWTTSKDIFNSKVVNLYTQLQSGTNWAEAIELAHTEAKAKNDGDPTYVMFLTDGAPSQYWRKSEQSGYYVSGEGCYLGARDEARAAVRDGVNLYTIFSYGTSTDQSNDYLGKLTDYAYNSDSAKESYRSYACSGTELENQLMSILNTIEEKHFGAGEVQINDGITELTTVTFEHIDPESFQYTITYKDYTNPEDDSAFTEHTLTAADGFAVSGTGSSQTLSIPSVTYHTWQNGEYKTVTTDEAVIKGAVFSGSPDKKVTWKLEKTDGKTYILEDNWTYKVKFKIWPSQDSYDLLAALNNGFLEWGEDFVNGDHTVSAADYMAQIDNTVSPYALKTNTTANVTYKKTTSTTVNEETTYQSGDTITVNLPTVDGMPLDNTQISLEKVWNSTLSTDDKPDAVDLYILVDPTETKIAAFNAAYETYAAAIKAAGDNAEAIAAAEAAFRPYYYFKAELNENGGWKQDVSIAPGVYDQYGHMNTTGHTYMVMEPAIDGHYELEATPTHPMLNGLTHDANDPNTLKDMIDVYTESGEIPANPPIYEQENQKSKYSVANTLKAGININKEIVDVPASQRDYLDMDEYFTVKVTLKDKNNAPVYDIVDGGGAVGYRIFAPVEIPEGATVVPAGAEGNDVTSYTINGITYNAAKTDGIITGFTARGLIGTDGTVTLKIRECDTLRIVNVPLGTTYTLEEIVANESDFEFKEIYWEVKKSNTVYDNNTATTTQTSITKTIVPDASNNIVFRNKPKDQLENLTMQKTGANGTGLSGAVFQLMVKNGTGIYQPVSEMEEYTGITLDGEALQTLMVAGVEKKSAFTTTGFVQNFTNLPVGGYKLVEVQSPAGYIISLSDIEFTVTSQGITMLTEAGTITFNAEPDSGSAQLVINNTPGAALPNTGGPGTRLFTILGSIFVMFAGVMLLKRERL